MPCRPARPTPLTGLLAADRTVVLCTHILPEVTQLCDKVVINDEQAAMEAVDFLVKSGKKRIALLTTESFLNVSEKRERGYRRALEQNGIPYDETLVLRLPFQFEEEELSKPFFETRQFDAVLSVNEVFAIRGMRLAGKMGLRIPEDVSFIGFTDGILSRYSMPVEICECMLQNQAREPDNLKNSSAECLSDQFKALIRLSCSCSSLFNHFSCDWN